MKIEERLTFRNEFGPVSRRGYEISISRLAAYEDSELSPKEVEAMKEKHIPKRPCANDNGGVEYYEEWLECPDCGEAIPEYTSENETECYCLGCGQKLKWGDTE